MTAARAVRLSALEIGLLMPLRCFLTPAAWWLVSTFTRHLAPIEAPP